MYSVLRKTIISKHIFQYAFSYASNLWFTCCCVNGPNMFYIKDAICIQFAKGFSASSQSDC